MRIGVLCDDEWHPAETVERGLAPLADEGLQFEYVRHAREWSASWMERFDAVILTKSNRTSAQDRTPWLTVNVQAAFVSYVERGGGLLVVHSGTVGYEAEPLFRPLVGGVFLRHPAPGAVELIPCVTADSACAITEGIDPFIVHDEHYEMACDIDGMDIFMRSKSEHGVQPAGWRRVQGAGRVAVLTPGHYVEVWLHPSYRTLIKRSLYWCAGKSETSSGDS